MKIGAGLVEISSIIFQNELRVNGVAGRLINFVAAEVTVKFVFVVVVAAEVRVSRGRARVFVFHST